MGAALSRPCEFDIRSSAPLRQPAFMIQRSITSWFADRRHRESSLVDGCAVVS